MSTKKVDKKQLWFSIDPDKKFMSEDQQDSQGRYKFEGVAYSGKPIMNHPYWGNLIFDVNSMQSEKITPIFRDHMPDREAGHGTLSFDNNEVRVNGFLYEKEGEKAFKLMKKGYPMQESVYIEPQSIVEVPEGMKANYNGQDIEGPMTVFLGGFIKEVSLVSLGADSNTSTTVFNSHNKGEVEIPVEESEQVTKEHNINEMENKIEEKKEESTQETQPSPVTEFAKGYDGFLQALQESAEVAYKFACDCAGEEASSEVEKLKAKIEELQAKLKEYKDKEKEAKKQAKESAIEKAFEGREVAESIKTILLSAEDEQFTKLLEDIVSLQPKTEEKTVDKALFEDSSKNEAVKSVDLSFEKKQFINEMKKEGKSLREAHLLAIKKFK